MWSPVPVWSSRLFLCDHPKCNNVSVSSAMAFVGGCSCAIIVPVWSSNFSKFGKVSVSLTMDSLKGCSCVISCSCMTTHLPKIWQCFSKFGYGTCRRLFLWDLLFLYDPLTLIFFWTCRQLFLWDLLFLYDPLIFFWIVSSLRLLCYSDECLLIIYSSLRKRAMPKVWCHQGFSLPVTILGESCFCMMVSVSSLSIGWSFSVWLWC